MSFQWVMAIPIFLWCQFIFTIKKIQQWWLVVELWTDNSLPSATVVQIQLKYGVFIVQERRLFVAHSYECRTPDSLLFIVQSVHG